MDCRGDGGGRDPRGHRLQRGLGRVSPAASPSTPSTSSTPQVQVATASPSSGNATHSAVGVPEPGSMDEPATSSGSLSKSSFPTPRELGPGWR